jgi:hypothetical protein
MAGTNSLYGTNYETLVLTAGLNTQPVPGNERSGLPKTYLRFNDAAQFPAANDGTAGAAAAGSLVLTTNLAAGPQAPAYPGFESSNPALPLNGAKQWASFNNAAGLNFAGQISLEAWIKPDAIQGARARIISHGPPTVCDFLVQPPDNSVTNSSEVFLRIDDSGANYVVGATQITFTNSTEISSNTYSASFPIPVGDLGGANWIHLVGAYDGANWRLYRNGALVATQASPVGAIAVNDADWAVGSTGNGWADAFAGLVDEVAIYSYALTANQVASHYKAGTLAPRLTVVPAGGGNVTITWPYGTLLESNDAAGPWTPVTGNPSSPFTTAAGANRKFYRF